MTLTGTVLRLVTAIGTIAASIAVFVQWYADVAAVAAALARELRDATGQTEAQRGQCEQRQQLPRLAAAGPLTGFEHLQRDKRNR